MVRTGPIVYLYPTGHSLLAATSSVVSRPCVVIAKPSHRRGSGVPQQREGHTVRSAAALEDLGDLGGDDLEAQGLELLIDLGVAGEGEDLAVAEALDIAVVLEDALARHLDELELALLEHAQEEVGHLLDGAHGHAGGDDVEGHVEVQVLGTELDAAHVVAQRLKDLGGIAQALPVGARDDAVHHGGLIEEPEVTALEGAASDLADDRHAEFAHLLLVVDLLVLAHGLVERTDDGAFGEAGAEVARVDHIGEALDGLDELHLCLLYT